MSLHQLCTAFDTQPRTRLWPGDILPSWPQPCCPPTRALQQHSIRLRWLHRCWLQGTHWWIQWGHILNPLMLCHRAEGDYPDSNLQKTGKRATHQQLHNERNSADCKAENIFHVCYPQETAEVTHKNLWLLLRETTLSR